MTAAVRADTMSAMVDAALARIYAANYDHIHRICLAYLHNHDDAAEAAQEVFIRALGHVEELEDERGWLQQVARNHCRDLLRQRSVRTAARPKGATPAQDGEDPERRALHRQALRAAFATLNHREREALGRAVLLDRPLQSVADELGVTYASAAQLVSRARRRAALAASAVVGLAVLVAGRIAAIRERIDAHPAGSAARPSAAVAVAAAVLCTSTAAHLAPPTSVSPSPRGGAGVSQTWVHTSGGAPAAAAPANPVVQAMVPAAAHLTPPDIAAAEAAAPAPAAAPAGATSSPAAPSDPEAAPPCSATQAQVGLSPQGGSATVSVCSSP